MKTNSYTNSEDRRAAKRKAEEGDTRHRANQTNKQHNNSYMIFAELAKFGKHMALWRFRMYVCV